MSENKKLTATTGKISPLTSKILDKEKLSVYLNAIEAGVKDERVLNIGLTGPYGSGKSSIIDTFVDNYKDHEYLKISLASFKEEITPNSNTDGKNDNLNHQIELSILQQIFYRVDASQIPNSRFKRIFNYSPLEMYSLLFGFVLWGMATSYIFEFQWLMNITGKKAALWFNYFMLIIFWIGLGFLFYKTYPLIRNLRIKKFTVKGEMEIDKEMDQSILNQYIDEIIYFFERTNYDIVIIEDLDRFKNTEIFTKLREINRIVNNSQQIGRKIRFIYALRDEMFQGSERTKFFDLIIPVIPFVNPSNSQEQLQAILDVSNIPKDEFSDDFIEDVVSFIDEIDMRLLINIVNEYILYRDNIKISQQKSHDKLFALIIYKNLYPQDFVELHTRKGKLFQFIENKEKFIVELLANTKLEIHQLKEEKKAIENERQTSIEELRAIYINAIRNFIPAICEVKIDGVFIPIEQLIEGDNFNFIKDSTIFTYKYFTDNYNHAFRKAESTANYKEIEKTLFEDSFIQRETRIIQYSTGHTDKILEHIQSLEQKKNSVKSFDFEQIFKLIEIGPFLSEFKENKLIRMLLLNGYIDETYFDYISYFHEVNLNRKEYEFVQNIKVGTENDFDYELFAYSHIIKKINKKYFSRPTILNFCLIEHLVDYKEKYPEQIKLIFEQFNNKNNRSISFIEYYLQQETNSKQEFLNLLIKAWPQFWEFVVKESNYPKSNQTTYLSQLLKYCSIEQLLSLDINRVLSDSIQKQEDLSLFKNLEANKLDSIFSKLQIKFSKLSKNNLNDNYSVFEIIEKGGYYKINGQMIALLLNYKTDGILIPVSYTNVLGSGNKKLIEIINANMKLFIEEVLLNDQNEVEEDEGAMAILLNLKILDTKELIKRLKFHISDIRIIERQLEKQLVIEENKIEPSWNNILLYYEHSENEKIDVSLVNYLNVKNNYTNIGEINNRTVAEINEVVVKSFFDNLVNCDDLSIESYSTLLLKTDIIWDFVEVDNLSEEKIDFLVYSGMLELTFENFSNLKELTTKSHIALIVKHHEKALKLVKELELDQSDVQQILITSGLQNDFKKELIQQLLAKDESLFIRNDEMAGFIIPILIEEEPIEISPATLSYLLQRTTGTRSQIRLLLKYKDIIDNTLFKELVKKLKGDYYKMLEPKKRPSFVLNELNLNLINELKKRNLIGRFIIDEKKKEIRVIALH